ncbi:MAG: hypothetical protein KDD45_15625, partial [Bdellovibrionales bacterium]|nr:hypothetical protein [Bdellovibrionales bacterium]
FSICEKIFWKKPEISKDLARWLHLKKQPSHKEGFTWAELSLLWIEAVLLVFMSKFDFLISIFEPALTHINQRKIKDLVQHSSGIIFFATNKKSKSDMFNHSRSILRTWLKLTELGYSAQPLSIGTIIPYTLKNGLLRLTDNPKLQKEILQSNNELSKLMKLPEDQEIIWGFRFGISKDKSISKKIIRRKDKLPISS